MQPAQILKLLIHFLALLTLLSSFSFAFAVDTDGDGVDDIQDAFPEDASQQYLPIDEALSKIEDPNLRSCLEGQTQGFQTAGELTETGCPQWNNVSSLEGLQHFTELEVVWGDGPNYSDLTPLQNLIDLRYLRLNHPQGIRISDAAP